MYGPVLMMRGYKVQSDMRIGLCFAEAAATARAAVGRTAVAFGPDNAMGHGPDDGTGNEAKGFLRLQGREFTPSAAARTSWGRWGE